MCIVNQIIMNTYSMMYITLSLTSEGNFLCEEPTETNNMQKKAITPSKYLFYTIK